MEAVGRSGKPAAGQGSSFERIAPFFASENLKPYISNDLRRSTTPIQFRTVQGRRAWGYRAELLPKELAAWAKRFPDEFYQKEARYLRDWGPCHPDAAQRLAPGLLQELEARNPRDEKGHRRAKHHQWLTEDVGHPALAQHLYAVIGFMRASNTWQDFYRLLQRAYPKKNTTMLLPGVD